MSRKRADFLFNWIDPDFLPFFFRLEKKTSTYSSESVEKKKKCPYLGVSKETLKKMSIAEADSTISLTMELKEAQAMEQRINDDEFVDVTAAHVCGLKKSTVLMVEGTRDG